MDKGMKQKSEMKVQKILKMNRRLLDMSVGAPCAKILSKGGAHSSVNIYEDSLTILDDIGVLELAKKEIEKIRALPNQLAESEKVFNELTYNANHTQNFWVGALIVLELEKEGQFEKISDIAHNAKSYDIKNTAAHVLERQKGIKPYLDKKLKKILHPRASSDQIDNTACEIKLSLVETLVGIRRAIKNKGSAEIVTKLLEETDDPWVVGYCVRTLRDLKQYETLRKVEYGKIEPYNEKLCQYSRYMARIEINKLIDVGFGQ